MMSSKIKFVRSVVKTAALANVPKHIDYFSKFSPSPLSMKQFLDFGECDMTVCRLLGCIILSDFCRVLPDSFRDNRSPTGLHVMTI